jgi:hypothetical protein
LSGARNNASNIHLTRYVPALHPRRPVGTADAPLRPEADVLLMPGATSPAGRVKAALASLGIKPPTPAARGASPRKGPAADPRARPSIMDYHAAFCSGAAGPDGLQPMCFGDRYTHAWQRGGCLAPDCFLLALRGR